MINHKKSNFLEKLIFLSYWVLHLSPPCCTSKPYTKKTRQNTHSYTQRQLHPIHSPKVHDWVTCGEINVILSLEMCLFMIINEDALEGKELCKHSSLKKMYFLPCLWDTNIHNSVQGLRFSVIMCQGLFITIANNFPEQISLILSSEWTSLPHQSCHAEI